MEANQLLKQLRKERNLSQRKLAEGISERSTLATFEQKGHRIAFDTLKAYLDRMNVTLEEFDYQLNDQALSDKIKLSRRMQQVYYQHDHATLTSLIDTAKQAYAASDDFMYYILSSQFTLILNNESQKQDTTERYEIEQKVKDYLNRIDTWGKFELSTFTNLLFLFDDTFILFQIEKLSQKKYFRNTLNQQYQIYTKLLTNAAYLFIDRKNPTALSTILSYLSSDLPPDNDRIRVMIRFFEGVLAIFHNDKEHGQETIDGALAVLLFIRQDRLAEQLKKVADTVQPYHAEPITTPKTK